MTPTTAEIEQFARHNESCVRARGGTVLGFDYYLSGARTHFRLGGTMPPAAIEFGRQPPEPPEASPRLLPAPLAAVPPGPVVQVVPAAVIADRARAAALIAMTAKGPEAEAECSAAITAGTSPEKYRATVAARLILDGMAARGR